MKTHIRNIQQFCFVLFFVVIVVVVVVVFAVKIADNFQMKNCDSLF